MQKIRLLLNRAAPIILGIIGVSMITWFCSSQNSNGRASPVMGNRMEQTKKLPNLFSLGNKDKHFLDQNRRGAKLFARYCQQCHTLPSPLTHTAEEWPGVADRMFRLMDMMAGHTTNIAIPSLEEQQAIIGYLKAHLSKKEGGIFSLKIKNL
jgi:hypothetical protein